MRTANEMFGKESLSVLALSVGIIILVGFNMVSYQMLQHEREHMSLVEHSRQIIDAATEILSAMKDAETGQRVSPYRGLPLLRTVPNSHQIHPFGS